MLKNKYFFSVEMPPRLDIQKTGKKYAKGILPKALVRLRGKHKKGKEVEVFKENHNGKIKVYIK